MSDVTVILAAIEQSDPQAADYPYGDMGVQQRDRHLAGGR